jgi:4-hydroxy-3-polyprenylbenzoate decarboxylase
MDLRYFIDQCEVAGELRRVSAEVDWNLEISHVSKLTEERKGPALLFENVKGYSTPVFTGAFATTKRLAIMLGLPANLSMCEAAREWMRKSISAEGLIKAKEVKDGPVLENVLEGSQVDLNMFPVPKFFPLDGGRYIGTTVFVVLRDPETGETNLGTYRMQMLDEKSCGVQILPGKRGERIMKKYRKMGRKMPAAAVIGCDPLLFMAGTLMHKGASDFDITGTVRGMQAEYLAAPLTGLPVPAGAELVLEGEIDPENFRSEGPFAEYTGYYTDELHKPIPKPALADPVGHRAGTAGNRRPHASGIHAHRDPVDRAGEDEDPGRSVGVRHAGERRALLGGGVGEADVSGAFPPGGRRGHRQQHRLLRHQGGDHGR